MVLGAVIGFLSMQVLGFLWYHPSLLGSMWMHATFPGRTSDDILKTSGSLKYPITMVAAAALVALSSFILSTLHVATVEGAVRIALLMGATMAIGDVSHYAFSQRSIVAFIIDHGYNTACLLATACSLVYFQ